MILLTEAVADGEEGVAAHGVGPRLGAALGVDVVAEAGDLAEEVVAPEFDEPLALMDGLGERGVPIEAVVVHLGIGVASAGVHGEVGVEGEVPGQLVVAVETIAEVPNVSRLLAERDVAVDVAVADVALGLQGELFFLETDTGLVAQGEGPYTAQLGICAARSDGQAGTLIVPQPQFAADVPELLFVHGAAPVDAQPGSPVAAADILRPVGAHTSCRVVGVTLCPCVVRQVSVETEADGLVYAVTGHAIRYVQIMLHRLFQVGIAEEDVQRVAAYRAVDEIGDGGCRRPQIVLHVEILSFDGILRHVVHVNVRTPQCVVARQAGGERLAAVVHALPLEVGAQLAEDANVAFLQSPAVIDVQACPPVQCLRGLPVTVLRVEQVVDAVAQIFVAVAVVVASAYTDGRTDAQLLVQVIVIVQACLPAVGVRRRFRAAVAMILSA